MTNKFSARRLIGEIEPDAQELVLRGWIFRLRALAKSSFIVLRDCSGEIQCVADSESIKHLHLKPEDCIEVSGRVVADSRAKKGFEVQAKEIRLLAGATHNLPFHCADDLSAVGSEALLEYRPLALRNPRLGKVFRLQNHILNHLRAALIRHRFTEIISSKLVASGTEGGTNLFRVDYFERTAYLAQSPQFYKEHGVAAFERVFEFGHVYRAEPHASSRHLTEYYSLDLEMGFIDDVYDVIAMERALLAELFVALQTNESELLRSFRNTPLPNMNQAPTWTFDECLELLATHHNRRDLRDDLDPNAERQLCALAQRQHGVAAVFVVGFPLSARPFYTAPQGNSDRAQSFDLLLEGVEITTGGKRLHQRRDLEAALTSRGLNATDFDSHLRMFDLGMPPHGGLAIGLERLTAQLLQLKNVRDAVLYPRDRYRLAP